MAEYDLGRAKGRIEIDTSSVPGSMRQVDSAISGVTGTAKKGHPILRAFGIGLVGLGTAATGVIGFGVKLASDLQQAEIAFSTMLGSGEKARAFLDELQAFAATTPFEFPQLTKAASSLISVGIEADKVIPIMTTLGDVTSGMGTGAEGVQRATIALQQMSAAGRITGEDLNQLRDAGIPVFDLLSAAIGKSKAEVVEMAKQGELGADALAAMMKALETGEGLERFSGLMEEQSQSLAGLFSTLKDTVGQTLVEIVQPLVAGLTKTLPEVTETITKVMQQIGPAFADVFAQLLPVVGRIFNALAPVVATFGKIFADILKQMAPLFADLVPLGKLLANTIAQLFQEAKPLIPVLIDIVSMGLRLLIVALKELRPILPEIIAGFVAFKVVRGVQSMLSSLTGIIPKVISALLGQAAAHSAAGAAATASGTAATAAGTAAQVAFGPWALIIALIVGAAILIIKNWDTVKKFLLAAWEQIKKAALVVWNAIKAAAGAVARFFIKIWNGFKTYWLTVWNIYRTIVMTVFNAIRTIVIAVMNFLLGFIKRVIQGFINIWNGLKTVVTGVWNAIKSIAIGVFNAIQGVFGRFREAIVRGWNLIKDIGVGIWDAIKGAAIAIFNTIANAWNNTVGKLSFRVPGWVPGIGGKGWDVPDIPTFAKGIRNFMGGFAIVGEQGPELAHLPRGTSVLPNNAYRALVGGGVGMDLRGLVIAGRLETAFGPADIEGMILDEIDNEADSRRTVGRMRRS